MDVFRITGSRPLCGEVRAGGSKNAALPMMAAGILAEGPLRLRRVPELTDVRTLSRVLRELGVEVERERDGAMLLQSVDTRPVRAEYELVRRMRASFCVLGPLLARRGKAVVSLPGGCNIGRRPVDLHLKGLAALGADLRLRHGYVIAEAKQLVGTSIDLAGPRGPTVTGTANVLSAAVLARGTTVIRHAAIEPEIVDLGNLMIAMGAKIDGLGTPVLEIAGVECLEGVSYRVISDRIEAATLLMAAAVTGGTATVTDVAPGDMTEVLVALRDAGVQLDVEADRIHVRCDGRPRPLQLTARPFPGIPTDLQAQFTALMSLADGRSTIRDTVFPNRFLHTSELNRLGARIEQGDGAAYVTGVDHLSGAEVTASDLRASAALVLAGLAARGNTTIRDIRHLDRGYEQLDVKLNRLGARIERFSPSGSPSQRPAPIDRTGDPPR